jgi:imidazolonepropionase-like amidohydrolase
MLNDEAIALMKQHRTYLVPTAYPCVDPAKMPPAIRPKWSRSFPWRRRATEAIRAGVKIAFGTDAAVCPHGDNAKEFLSWSAMA